MNRFVLPVLLLGVCATTVAEAGDTPARPAAAKRIWTSEDVEALRVRGVISLVGAQPAKASSVTQAPEPTRAPRPIRALDPEWYHEQVSDLRAAMEPITAQINLIRRELRDARYWEAGVSLARENPGITPYAAIQVLSRRNGEVLAKIETLEDQARRYRIPPGATR